MVVVVGRCRGSSSQRLIQPWSLLTLLVGYRCCSCDCSLLSMMFLLLMMMLGIYMVGVDVVAAVVVRCRCYE